MIVGMDELMFIIPHSNWRNRYQTRDVRTLSPCTTYGK